MRVAAQVFVAYLVILILGVVWQFVPASQATPSVIGLISVYLGLTARQSIAPATCGAVAIGYLGDLLFGTPLGLHASVAGVACIVGHLVHRRLLVRGIGVTTGFSLFIGVLAGFVELIVRLYLGIAPLGAETGTLVVSAMCTAIAGPIVFRLCRAVDARFARTHREREAALEGHTP